MWFVEYNSLNKVKALCKPIISPLNPVFLRDSRTLIPFSNFKSSIYAQNLNVNSLYFSIVSSEIALLNGFKEFSTI